MSAEKRRSDRLLLTIPLQIEGVDSKGITFKGEARTVSVSRHGTCIRIARALDSGQVLRVSNRVTRKDAEFRVVGRICADSADNQEYGLEVLDEQQNIWGINFPPAPKEGSNKSKGLLKCLSCQKVTLLELSMIEVEVLENAGTLQRTCKVCAVATQWGYAEGDAEPRREDSPEDDSFGAELNFRTRRRAALQLPLMVRKHSGGTEVTKCENISKGGLSFVSDKHYFPGEKIVVACPYDAKGQNIEVEAEIVRQQPLEGTKQRIYGVRYTSEQK